GMSRLELSQERVEADVAGVVGPPVGCLGSLCRVRRRRRLGDDHDAGTSGIEPSERAIHARHDLGFPPGRLRNDRVATDHQVGFLPRAHPDHDCGSRTEAGSASGPRRRFASTAWSVSAGRGGPHRSGSPYPQKNFGGPDASGLVAGTATTVDVTEETTGLVESGDLAAGADAHDASP